MKRVFAAIVPRPNAIAELSTRIDELRSAFPLVKASWVPPENLHLTLHFAGELDETRLTELQSRVEAAAAQTLAFRAELGESGAFVDKRLGRSVLWVGIRINEPGVAAVKDAVRKIAALERAKSKGFVAHLTLARIRGEAPTALLEAHRSRASAGAAFDVDEFVVFESTLTKGGPIYRVLSRHNCARLEQR